MKHSITKLALALSLTGAVLTACNKKDDYIPPPTTNPEPIPNPPTPPNVQSIIFSISGDITDMVTAFRSSLGDVNPNNGLSFPSGRREINWDGVPDAQTNTNTFSPVFFNVNSPRGLVLENTGAFRVSKNDFEDVTLGFASSINPFSPIRTFVNMASPVTVVTFRVPGKDSLAAVNAFGAVFLDVDQNDSTTMEFFAGNFSLGKIKVQKRAPGDSDKGKSFLGVKFSDAVVTKVIITAGTATMLNKPFNENVDVSNGGGVKDIVVMDDFIYGEPKKLQ
jgi:hypothetical protein